METSIHFESISTDPQDMSGVLRGASNSASHSVTLQLHEEKTPTEDLAGDVTRNPSMGVGGKPPTYSGPRHGGAKDFTLGVSGDGKRNLGNTGGSGGNGGGGGGSR